MQDKTRRHLFSFSLRTLFVLVTVLCVWFGYEMNAIRERRNLLARIEENGGEIEFDPAPVDGLRERVPWFRKLLGDTDVAQIKFPDSLTEGEWHQAERAFPESVIWLTSVRWTFSAETAEGIPKKPLTDNELTITIRPPPH